ncbi:hypothetical protein [Shinella zoogloeoides]|uniref:hypothetical protein n=1 Tax=Shinella zoogloeoides TaxID=352475 RepID=UPI00299E4B28|nr:hypothetical protein [Shinella zoogloeoides]WPE22462.1 hypothetical protein ShzoTeo12_36780 [Shinella zoogloeoides]
MTWNFDLTKAPRDGIRILMADTHGDMWITKWLEPNKRRPAGRFDMFPENAKTILAWQHLPVHPHHMEVSSLCEVTPEQIPIVDGVGGTEHE